MSSSELCFLTATELAGRLRRREVSCQEALEAHLRQIERINPQVNAIVTLIAEQALDQARQADETRPADMGPLYGLPIAHKDLVLTKGIRTTLGSPIFADFVPDQDEIIVERMRQAGAITIGKTNAPEFGAGSQTYNTVFGATHNPYDLSKTCGGSSGGAAVSLASGMLPLADGSDLGGSLRNPASFCNVVGLRPSPGRVPTWPHRVAWFPFAVEGPMARTVQDAALLLSVLAGPDPRTPQAINEPGSLFSQDLERSFAGTRIAWSPTLGGLPVDPQVTAVLESQRAVFEQLGCVVEEATPDFRDADEIFRVWRAWYFELALGELLTEHRAQMKDSVVWNIEQGQQLSGPQIGQAERKRTELYHRMREFMDRYAFLVAPVSQVPPFPVTQEYVTEINGIALDTYLDWMKSCYYVSVTGLPAISVPCGFTPQGLPVGVQIVGRYQGDLGLLRFAHAFEQATQVWKRRPALQEIADN